MKKIFAVTLLVLLPVFAFAVDLTPLDYEFPVYGSVVDNTFKSTLDNTAKTIKTLAEAAGITWVQNGQSPHGVIFSVETYDARMGTANVSAALGIGHVVAVGSSGRLAGAGYIANTYFINKTAADNAVIQITLER